MWYFYAVALPVTLGMVFYTLQYFASPKVPQHVKAVVCYAWLVNMSIVILVPVDVWTTICTNNAEDYALVCSNPGMVGVLWSLAYWSAFFLTWLIIPMMSGYEDAADFTMSKRLKSSLRGNLIFYCSVGGVAVVGAIVMVATKQWEKLMGLAIGASNAFGLVTGALLLGFGLIEIPRGLWRHADLSERAKWLSHKVAKVAEKLDEAHKELSTAIVITQATSKQVSRRDPLRPMMDIIDNMANEDPSFKATGGRLGENDMDYDTDEKSMAALRWRLRHAQDMYSRYKTEYTSVVWQALRVEDTIKNVDIWSHEGGHFVSSFRAQRKGTFAFILDGTEWLWRCLVEQWVMRLLAVILGILSVALIFAEATMLSQQWVDLSLFSVLVAAAELREEVVQLVVFVPLVYICMCTYYSVFKLGIFSFYYLVRSHTDSVSLLMNCSMVSRYAAPMCYNFLSLIHLTKYNLKTGKIEYLSTTFEDRMSVLPDKMERIYPLVMVVWCMLIAGNVHNRLLDVFGSWRRFGFENDDDLGGEGDGYSPAGLIILRRERASAERGVAIGDNVVPLARHFANGEDVEALVAPPTPLPSQPASTPHKGTAPMTPSTPANNKGSDSNQHYATLNGNAAHTAPPRTSRTRSPSPTHGLTASFETPSASSASYHQQREAIAAKYGRSYQKSGTPGGAVPTGGLDGGVSPFTDATPADKKRRPGGVSFAPSQAGFQTPSRGEGGLSGGMGGGSSWLPGEQSRASRAGEDHHHRLLNDSRSHLPPRGPSEHHGRLSGAGGSKEDLRESERASMLDSHGSLGDSQWDVMKSKFRQIASGFPLTSAGGGTWGDGATGGGGGGNGQLAGSDGNGAGGGGSNRWQGSERGGGLATANDSPSTPFQQLPVRGGRRGRGMLDDEDEEPLSGGYRSNSSLLRSAGAELGGSEIGSGGRDTSGHH
eukprot:TRINITY_DN19250_c0_g1_i1.p1 TRINITY_DN19250_c0_g1~~TRINITY_DN19250_c0_g1_i1.p1  ORF type:complete len:937 (-),score=163.36 TRINITY_DN19250_c0_g1_i1:569-3379(-)